MTTGQTNKRTNDSVEYKLLFCGFALLHCLPYGYMYISDLGTGNDQRRSQTIKDFKENLKCERTIDCHHQFHQRQHQQLFEYNKI